jgi:hypothetical protein
MVGTGHGVGKCEPNPELVAELRRLNSGEPAMKLGEKLKQTLEELERARISSLEAQASAELEKVRRERKDLAEWLERIRLDFIDQINASRVPLNKIKNYERETWLKKAIQNKAEHQDLWNLFTRFWATEGLDVAVIDAHDGVGQESWINLTLKIMPPRPRGSASNDIGVYNG